MLVADVVLPPPDITVSQWADENRRLSSESAAERGEWRTDRAPYQRAIMDALSPIASLRAGGADERRAVGQIQHAGELHRLHHRPRSWADSSGAAARGRLRRRSPRTAWRPCCGTAPRPARQDRRGPQPRFEQHDPAQEVHRRQHHHVGVEFAGRTRHAQRSLLPAGRGGPLPGQRRQRGRSSEPRRHPHRQLLEPEDRSVLDADGEGHVADRGRLAGIEPADATGCRARTAARTRCCGGPTWSGRKASRRRPSTAASTAAR